MGIFGAFFLTAAASTASSFLLCSLFPFLSWVHEMLVLLSTWPSPDKPKRSSKKKSAKRSGIFGFLLPSLTNGLFLSLVFQICICKAEVSFSLFPPPQICVSLLDSNVIYSGKSSTAGEIKPQVIPLLSLYISSCCLIP